MIFIVFSILLFIISIQCVSNFCHSIIISYTVCESIISNTYNHTVLFIMPQLKMKLTIMFTILT
ncbi:hypothetical protein FM106_21630 [Brachybacterium faecium]|nr:hypothetical protein FM106_21630 [Brachybacterium faecium]